MAESNALTRSKATAKSKLYASADEALKGLVADGQTLAVGGDWGVILAVPADVQPPPADI